jgi:hypothetical protein
MVEGRTHLNHVDTHDGKFQTNPADGIEQLARREATGFWRPGAGSMPRIAHINIDRQKDAITVTGRDRERFRQTLIKSAVHDLGHLV